MLDYVHKTYKDAEKVDFVVERNGPITKHLLRFHKSMARGLVSANAEHLGRLVGELIPGDKTRVPLQAADLLLWHAQASKTGALTIEDRRRFARLNGRGLLVEYTKDSVVDFARRAHDAVIDNADDLYESS